MKIALLTLGTRGDVQPYAVLGRALARRGHTVTLSTAKTFENLVKSYGLSFEPVESAYPELLTSEEGTEMMMGNLFAIRRNLEKWLYPLIEDSLDLFYRLSREHDRVIYRPKTLADVFAGQFPEKMIRAALVPALQPTEVFPNPTLSGFAIPKPFNKWSFELANLGINFLEKPISRFREKNGLKALARPPGIPVLYPISDHFLPKPHDYPDNQHFTGFWFDSAPERLPEKLSRFLDAGEPPIVITFGSMHLKSEVDISRLVEKIPDQTGCRVVLVKGWGLRDILPSGTDPRICTVDAVPYPELFPRVKAVVHHGGIGTTAECLRAGKPMLICPVLYPVGDQKFWGDVAFRSGVGVEPLPVSRITENTFFERLSILLNDETLYENARSLSELLREEDGIMQAINWVEKGQA